MTTAWTNPMERRCPMELQLTGPETKLMKEILHADLSNLLLEISRTDNRAMREGLKNREMLLKGILDRLEVPVVKAS
jgi:hypothetical protein